MSLRPASRRLPRLAVLSHSAVEPSQRRKWELVARDGWQVLLLVPSAWPEASRWIRGAPARRGRCETRVLGALFKGRTARWIPLGLGRELAAFAPDLVHAEEEYFGMSCWLAAREAGELGTPFSFFTWENIFRGYRPFQGRIIRRVLGAAAGAVAGNGEAGRILRRRGFRGPVAVIPQYGVDTALFRPRPRAACRRALGWPVSGRVAGFIGRLLPEKGVEILLRACTEAPGGMRAAVVGTGPHAESLRKLASVILPGRALFRGPVPHTRVPVVLGALDALVLPSLTTRGWKEQFGRILAEALACGRLALGSSSGEIPRVLGSRRLVFREGDARGLARLLASLVVRGRGRKLAVAARARAVRLFSDRAVAAATSRFLRGLLDRRVRTV